LEWLSHLALELMGEGEVFYKEERMDAISALSKEGIVPLTLKAKKVWS
jgi:histidine ammonia-lyase